MPFRQFSILHITILLSFIFTAGTGLHAGNDPVLPDTLRPAAYVLSYALPEEIVVTGTRTRIPIWRSPAPVTVIDDDDIRRSGDITVGELLESNGAAITRRYGSSGLATASVRGLSADQTLVLINGVRVNSPQNGMVDLSTIPLYGIKRIEVNRGGASSLYGSSALGGIINIITEVPEDTESFAEIYAGTGSYGFRRLNIRGGIQSKIYGFAVTAGTERAQDDFTFTSRFVPDGRMVKRLNADYTYNHLSIDGRYRFREERSVGYFIRYSHADRGAPGPYVGGIQSGARQVDTHIQTAITYNDLLNDRWLLRITPKYMYSKIEYSDTGIQIGGTHLDSRSVTEQIGGSFDISGALNRSLMLTTGGELSYAQIDADNIVDGVRRLDLTTFVIAAWDIISSDHTRITLYPSMRYDRLRNTSALSELVYDQLTWRFGLNTKPFPYDRFILRASVGRNFKAPNFNDLYWVPGGNPDLKPEHSDSYDAGFRLSVPVFRGVMTFDGSVFYIQTRDRIVWQPGSISSIWSPVNFDEVRSFGMEVYTGWSSDNGLYNLSFTYSLQDVYAYYSDYPTGKRPLPYIPRENLHLNLAFTGNPVDVSIQPRYTGFRYLPGDDGRYLPAYLTADLHINITFRIFMLYSTAGLQVKNIFDEQYELIQNYPMPGRQFRATIRLEY
jgi:vitamin B12 transporter